MRSLVWGIVDVADLVGHVGENRTEFLVDLFTILQGYLQSGKKSELDPWGGFEGWSELIRGAIHWLGVTDPYTATKEKKSETASEDIFPDLLEAMIEAGIGDEGQTSKEILEIVNLASADGMWVNSRLRGLLSVLSKDQALTPGRVTSALRKFAGRVAKLEASGGVSQLHKLQSSFDSNKKIKKWSIVNLSKS